MRDYLTPVQCNEAPMSKDEYRDAVTRRFLELGNAGANALLKHPGRKEWERLRAEIKSWEG